MPNVTHLFNEEINMTRLGVSVFFVATFIVIAVTNISVDAQTTTRTVPSAMSKSATMSLSISVPIEQITLGQKPWVSLTVKNLGSEAIAYPRERIYIEGPKGEPQTTHVQRAMTHRLNPGEADIRETGFRPPIAPGDSFTMKYDLSYFYDFKEPGKYTVYIEVFDRLSEKPNAKNDTDNWLRSPLAKFELLPPTP
jgi:hypothetical protein